MSYRPFQGPAPAPAPALAPALALALAQRCSDALPALRDRDSHVTLIITESNPGLLRSFADRVLVIERGEVQEGSIQPGRTAA